jgi:hypothetical protein
MALRSGLHTLISRLQDNSVGWNRGSMPAFLWAAFLTLAVTGPWLLPGYIFGTDWPGPRHLPLPTSLDSSAPLRTALAAVAWAAGAEVAGKVLVLGSMFAAGMLAFKAIPTGGFVPRAAAATLYVVNPFVYGRLHYGQLFLVAAYAALPWVLLRLGKLFLEPDLRSSLWAAAALTLVGLLTPHMLLMAALLAAAVYVAQVVLHRERLDYLRKTGSWVALTVVSATLASAYWLIPLVLGRGTEGAIVEGTGPGALSAYEAIPDNSLGLLPNLLGLYGFWAEDTNRFTSLKAFAPWWPAVLGAILLIAGVGAYTALRDRSDRLSPWVAGLLLAGALALVLETGNSHPLTAGLVGWLDTHFVPYRGMRDAGKWAAVLALVYSQLLGLGTRAVLAWIGQRSLDRSRREWAIGTATAVALAVPLYYGNGLLFGAHGEIKPSQYPAGWYQADRVLEAGRNPGKTLFLPWHEYMSYSFIRNQNSVVAAPAPAFFSVPILASSNPEVPGIGAPTDRDQVAISVLVNSGSRGQWAEVLATHGVKYVLLARELDWSAYQYLDDQSGLVRVGDYGSILLYRNTLVPAD